MTKIIEAKKISKEYGKKIKTKVLFGIDLKIEKGEFVAIIGESGSGKSTLLNMISTLDNPTSGSVFISGKEIKKLKNRELSELRNEKMGFVFQFHFLIPELNVLENVMTYSNISKKLSRQSRIERAKKLLELVGLKKYINNKSTELSGGQMQRVAIARALMNEPEIIFADEPTGNLDSKTTSEIYELFREINKELKTTIVVITHDRKVAEKTDRIIEIEDGRVQNDFKKS